MFDFQYIGALAAVLTTSAFLPQALKTIRDKDTRSLSLGMYLVMTFGTMMWVVYGFSIKDIPLLVANVVTGLLSFLILFLKIKNDVFSKKESLAVKGELK